MKRKVFVDILKDYQELKFIYEYGFPWDDRLTNLLFGKTSQISRRLALALSDEIEEVSKESWQQLQEGAQKSKFDRKIIRKNVYHLSKKLWYQNLYAGYGKTDNMITEDTDGETDEGNLLSKVYDYRELITRLLYERKKEYWFERDIDDVKMREYLRREFPDILKDAGAVRVVLKRNGWNEKNLSTYFKAQELEEIFQMLAFFSEFAPLGILGSNFLNRLGKETTHPFLFVRNLPYNHAFDQEIIYRCLYAINRGKMLGIYDGEECRVIEPKQILYDNHDMWRRRSRLYVTDKTGEKIVLHGKKYLEVLERTEAGQKSGDVVPSDDVMRKFEVFFLKNTRGMYGELTEYLDEKKRIFEEDSTDSHIIDEMIKMDSPYYPENHEWEIEKVSYEIQEKNLEGFLEFIDSFGDFAFLAGPSEPDDRYSAGDKMGEPKKRKAVLGEESLCNPYTSEGLYQWLETKTEYTREDLPPMQAELDWLYFILKSYPNLCQVFIRENVYLKLLELLGTHQERFLSVEKLDVRDRIQDIRKGTVNKYEQIYQAVKCGAILCGKYKDENRSVFPYALQYYAYVPDSYEKGKREHPLEIMAYDLTAKRNVLLVYQNINIKETIGKQQYVFSDLDKIYHCLANAIRYAIEAERGKIGRLEEPADKISDFLETIWKMDNRSPNTAYQRKIQKQYGKTYDYHQEYLKLLDLVKEPCEQEFVRNVFAFWDDKYLIGDAGQDEEKRYQTFLLRCFTEALKRYHSRAGSYMKEMLEKVTAPDIWTMISGGNDRVINEIAFYNEYLKNERVSFLLKEPTEEKIDRIYRLFSDFTCTGELSKDGTEIRFTVTYEKFYYRKIHMYLMILYDDITNIGPERVSDIIKQRINNKKRIGEELWNRGMF